jgi:hypothetical protein
MSALKIDPEYLEEEEDPEENGLDHAPSVELNTDFIQISCIGANRDSLLR